MKFIKNLFIGKEQTKVFDIKLENLKNAFSQMENEAHWDTSKKMYWGYYFLDQDLEKVKKFAQLLKDKRLSIVEIRRIEQNGLYLLHAEVHKIHTPESLYEQCHALAKLANDHNFEIFDGWDVEAIKMNKGLVE